jgi:hypothetical protein
LRSRRLFRRARAVAVVAVAAVGIAAASASLARESLLRRAVAGPDGVLHQAGHRRQEQRAQVVQAQQAHHRWVHLRPALEESLEEGVLQLLQQLQHQDNHQRLQLAEAIAAEDQQHQAFPAHPPAVRAADLDARLASCT